MTSIRTDVFALNIACTLLLIAILRVEAQTPSNIDLNPIAVFSLHVAKGSGDKADASASLEFPSPKGGDDFLYVIRTPKTIENPVTHANPATSPAKAATTPSTVRNAFGSATLRIEADHSDGDSLQFRPGRNFSCSGSIRKFSLAADSNDCDLTIVIEKYARQSKKD